jgi:hypothetical protein
MEGYFEEELEESEKNKRKVNIVKVLSYGESVRELKFKKSKEDIAEKIDDALLRVSPDDTSRDELIYMIDPEDTEEAEKIVKLFEDESLLEIKHKRIKIINELRELYNLPKETAEEDKPVPPKRRLPVQKKDEVSVVSPITSERHYYRKIRSRALFRWFLVGSFILAILISYSKLKKHVNYAINYWRNKGEDAVSRMAYGDRIENRERETEGEREAIRLKKMLEKYTTEQYDVKGGSKTVR